MNLENINEGPQDEIYASARYIGKVAHMYGEHGKALIDGWKYARWVDNIVDEGVNTQEEKLDFLYRQINLILGKQMDDYAEKERLIMNLPWHLLPEQEMKKELCYLLQTQVSDVLHLGYEPRTDEDIKAHSQKMFSAIFNLTSLSLNGHSISPHPQYLDFMFFANKLGALLDFEEDVNSGLLNVPFTERECEIIRNIPTPGRREVVLKIYTPERFQFERALTDQGYTETYSSILQLNLPLWQRLAGYTYFALTHNHTISQAVYPSSFS